MYVHDTIPAPPPIDMETIPPPTDTVRDNQIPEMTEENVIDTNVPLWMLLISFAAVGVSMFYCCCQ
jgi:hypothetical protein